LRTSVVERSHTVGVEVLGSDATIDATTVRDTLAEVLTGNFGRALDIEDDRTSKQRASANVTRTACFSSREIGVLILDSDLTADGLLVVDTQAREGDGLFGDGIDVFALAADASANVTASRIVKSARAGLSSFGANLELGASALECDAIPIDGESVSSNAPTFVDDGGNACACSGAGVVCQVLTNGLAPPAPVGP
jgi:hypothetical protein